MSSGCTTVLCTILVLFSVPATFAWSFDHYVFAQQWPQSVCFDSSKDFCDLSPNITMWTIHGLWPDPAENCNSSWAFNEKDVAGLEDAMRARWPSFSGTDLKFWRHEWEKHGTCASIKPEVSGIYKFFNKTLELNRKYDLLIAYESVGLGPGEDNCYSYDEFTSVNEKLFNNSYSLGCSYDKSTGKQYIAQVELCLDLDFQVACKLDLDRSRYLAKSRHMLGMPWIDPCKQDEKICYPPLRYQKKRVDRNDNV